MKSIVLQIFNDALKFAQPSNLLSKSLSLDNNKINILSDQIIEINKIKFISFGKAGGSMAKAFLDIVGYDNITEGIIVLPEYSPELNIHEPNIEIVYSTHPFVSKKSVVAGNKVLEFASRCKEDETVFCLISGGGSALLASPIDGFNVKQKIELINNLLKMGIGEREVNIIRKKLSKIKGGSLAKKIFPSQIINLILSDEREHQLEAIASGPTVINNSKLTAKEIINENYLWNYIPKNSHYIFDDNEIDDKNLFPKINSYIIGSREDLISAINTIGKSIPLNGIKIINKFFDQDIDQLKNELTNKFINFYNKSKKGKYLLVACGEVPVNVNNSSGKGGRNQHLAALMIKGLSVFNNFEFLAIASDGCDFVNGIHGVLINNHNIKKINSLSIDVNNYINDFNSYDLHKLIGSHIEGPMTGTNVNDYYLFYFEK